MALKDRMYPSLLLYIRRHPKDTRARERSVRRTADSSSSDNGMRLEPPFDALLRQVVAQHGLTLPSDALEILTQIKEALPKTSNTEIVRWWVLNNG